MSRRKKWSIAALLALLVLFGATGWLVGTQTGTRWVVDRASAFLPDQLSIDGVSGTLLRGVRIEQLRWLDSETDVNVESLFVSVRLLPLVSRNVIVDELDIGAMNLALGSSEENSGSKGTSEFSLPIDLRVFESSIRNIGVITPGSARRIDELSMAGRLDGSDLEIRQLNIRSDWLDTDISGNARLSGRFGASIDATWSWKALAQGPLSGTLTLSGDRREYEIEHALSAPFAVMTKGTVAFDQGVPTFDIESTWESIELALPQGGVSARKGSLLLDGTLDRLDVELDTFATLDPYPESRITLTGIADPEQVDIHSLMLHGPIGIASISGSAAWLPDPSVDIDYSLSDVDLSHALQTITSRLAAEGSLSAQLTDAGPQVDTDIDTISGTLNQYAVDGSGGVRVDVAQVRLDGVQVAVGDNRLRIDGSINEQLSLATSIDARDLGQLLPSAAGSLSGTLDVRGDRASPALRFDLSAADIAWQQTSISSVEAEGLLSPTGRSEATLRGTGIAFNERNVESLALDVDGDIDSHNIRVSAKGFDSEIDLAASGGYSDEQWLGELSALTVDNAFAAQWTTREASKLSVSAAAFSLDETCLYRDVDEAALCLTGSMDESGAVEATASIDDLSLETLRRGLPPELSLKGRVYASVDARWSDQALNAQSRTEIRDGGVSIVYDEQPAQVDVSTFIAETTVRDNRLESGLRFGVDDTADITARVEIDNLLDADASITSRSDVSIPSISAIGALIPAIGNPQGSLRGSLVATGSLMSPELVGDLRLEDGRFDVRAAGTTVSDVSLRVRQLAPGQLRVSGRARSGEGQVSIDGRTFISTETGLRSELSIDGKDFVLSQRPDLQVTASPDIDIVFDDNTTLVSGNLDIPFANIRVRDVPETATRSSADAVVHRDNEAAATKKRRIAIDVSTELGEDVRFSGFGLTTRFEGGVRIRGGNTQAYTGQGKVDLIGGKYKSYGQELDIEEGELIFSGPLENPRLNVRAVRTIKDIVAGINLSGTPANLQSRLFSEPAMTDAETLSYLLTGRPLSGASRGSDGDMLNKAAFSLGLSGAGLIVSQVRSSLGLETLSIEGGSSDSRLIAGKRIGDRLLIEYGYGLVDQLGTLLLRYELTDRLTLESRTGTVSNLDILYSVKRE